MRFSNHIPPRPSAAPPHWLVCCLLLAAMLSYLVMEPGQCTTNAGDLKVLQDLLKSASNAAEKLADWTGDDPCGSPAWSYVQCSGSRVTELQLKGAGLQGELPASLNRLTSLQTIALQGNSFSGPLPSLSGLSQLSSAYLGDQQFSSIPSDFFSGLTSLSVLTLQNNPLNASDGWSLPADIALASALSSLTLTNVSLSGAVPNALGNLSSLQELHLAYNRLSGALPASFSGLGQLARLELNNQQPPGGLSGPIDVVVQMPSLAYLWLQVNSFSGTIPPALGSSVSLQDCRLNDNALVGEIPSTFAASSSLQFLSVSNNRLVGPIPAIPSLNSTSYIFSGNSFCESAVGAACAPEVTALLSFLGGVNYPASLLNSWEGNDPCSSWQGITCDSDKKHVTVLNLPRSQLTGTISPDLANLTSLARLVLSGNNLTGNIPASLTQLTSLVLIDVSNNNIYGPVPSFNARVSVLTGGNANINKVLPSSTPGSSSSNSPASSNPNSAQGSSSSSSGSGKRFSMSAIAGVVVGVSAILFFAAIIGFVIFKNKRHRFQRVQSPNAVYMRPADGGSDTDMVKITVQSNNAGAVTNGGTLQSHNSDNVQVLEAGNLIISIELLRNVTNNFSEDNVLGRGGFGVVYKGELDDGTKIAVKRMLASVVSNKGLDEFQAEIAVLTKVRHRHLVAMLGYCIEGNERLLVYEYMPLGTLSQHLFEWKKLDLPPLSWDKRLSIALDVARAVEYLHGLAQKSFIHRDLKPSNVLLGDGYRAKVSDFGLVKLAPEGKFSVETRLAGTFGYLAPEYAVTGRVTTKADVFSFGVILMELITGRKALDETQPEESMHLVTWFRRLMGNKAAIFKAVDPAVEVNDETSQSVLIVAELAGHCTGREPYNRPDMSHAVNVLSPLVEQWKPADAAAAEDDEGIDLHMSLPQALKRWQAIEGGASSMTAAAAAAADDGPSNYYDDITRGSVASMPACPSGLVQSFTSVDGR